jgi:ketosteroid isomerase-like protein
MSQPNAAVVERVVDAWNRRDLGAPVALSHPDAAYMNAPNALEPGTRHGDDGLAVVMRRQWEGLGPEARQEIDRIHEVDGDIVTESRVSRTMPGSSTRPENRVAIRWSLGDGLVTRIEVLGAGSGFKPGLESAGIQMWFMPRDALVAASVHTPTER